MNYNILNGGLVVKHQGKLLFATPGKEHFLNSVDDELFFCNALQDNCIMFRKSNGAETVLLDNPCSNLIVSAGYAYFINESDNKVYRMSVTGGSPVCVESRETSSFLVNSNGEVQPFESEHIFINRNNEYEYFCDQQNDNAIYRKDIGGSAAVKIWGESAGFLHLIDDILYFLTDDGWKSLSIYGGSAEKVLI